MPSRDRSLRSRLLGALVSPLVFLGVALTVLGQAPVEARPATQVEVAPAADRVGTLMEAHDCWTGAAPANVGPYGPGHAVVTLPGQHARFVKADIGYGIWLGPDGVKETGDEAPGALNGFCR